MSFGRPTESFDDLAVHNFLTELVLLPGQALLPSDGIREVMGILDILSNATLGEDLTLEGVAELMSRPVEAAQRILEEGSVPGSYKRRGEWRVPLESMRSPGLRVRQ